MNFNEDARYFQYVIESAIEHEKMQGFIRTITGVNEDASYKKLDSIHEAVSDKIRSLWDKFMAFLNRVWAKFVEFTNKMIANEKEYLEKYKDIILNTKPKDIELEMRDYAEGIRNMTKTMIPTFGSSKQFLTTDSATTHIGFKTHLIPAYTDANKDFAGVATAYFQGGEDKKTINMQSLHMTDLYNYCHDFEKIKSVIEKDKVTLSKAINDVQGEIDKVGTTKPADPAPVVTPKAESAIDNFIKTYFTEAPDATGASTSTGMTVKTGQSDTNAAANAGVTASSDPTKASANMHSVHATDDKNKATGVTDATEGSEHLTKLLSAYNSVAGHVLSAKLTSATAIFKDYMKIIKLHVGAHVGKDSDTQVAKSGSKYNQALVIDKDDAADILAKIAKIEDPANKDNNEKHALTVELNKQVQGKNPNFPGGIEAIKTAATNANAK